MLNSRFFIGFDKDTISRIKKEQRKEYRGDRIMRIIITVFAVAALAAPLVAWWITGKPNWLALSSGGTLFAIVIFHWLWYRLLLRMSGEWKQEAEREELHFTELLIKHLNIVEIENSIRDLDTRLAKLERKARPK
jgi:membrane protein YdbS with pleckstrin-like domain